MTSTAQDRRFQVRLDTRSGVPAYRQIIDQVLGGIASGTLKPGDQLPTVRQLAVDLAINPNTVVRAYRELEIREVLATQQGTGTFVTDKKPKASEVERRRRVGAARRRIARQSRSRGNLARRTTGIFRRVEKGTGKGLVMLLRTHHETKRHEGFGRLGRVTGKQHRRSCISDRAGGRGGGHGCCTISRPSPIAGVLIGLYFLFAIKVAEQWQKAAVLRLGRYIGLRGPGLFMIIPVIDSVSQYVDQRVRVTDVKAESALTRDTVPVNVDAIVFWLVWNAEKSILEVMDFDNAITMSAQTALRESIGRHDLAQMITEREMLGRELQRILDEKTNPWGITVQSVEIRDVHIPQALEDAMSRQAQAERERQARIILGTAETEISSKFAEASAVYMNNPVALHLRAMNMLYEAIKEKGSMVIVPSSAVETMGLGGLLGTASLSGTKQ